MATLKTMLNLTLRIIFASFVTLSPLYCFAQISYGGKPLRFGVEYISGLRTAVDYFVEMPAFNVDSVKAVDDLPVNRIGGLRFAHTFFKDLTPENSGITFHSDDGTKIWKVGVRSPGAFSLNVLFSEFDLPDSAKVFIYNSDRSRVMGAFTNKNRPKGGEFSIAPVEGDELTVEYHEPADAPFSGRIRISEINHDYRGLFRSGTRFNLLNLPCLPDITCNKQYDIISGSVCLLIVDGTSYSSGVLVNNTARDGKPYLLTASHCIKNKASMGSRVVVFMNYQSPNCDKRIRGSEEFSLSGSVTRAFSNEIDFALLELMEMPPVDYRPYLAGWTNDSTADESPFTGIHHPFGEGKSYCVENDNLTKIDWPSSGNDGIAKGNHWNVHKWETGHTWAGSSGSPIFDKNMHIRGGLTGGDSGGDNGCEDYETGDFYFRFDRAWDQYPDSSKQLKYWLDPSCPNNISRITSVDGMDPYFQNPAKRITNIIPTDSLDIIQLESPYHGPMFGQNSLSISQYAEHFTTKNSSMIKGVYLMAAKGSKNTNVPLTVRIFEGGANPGVVLQKAVLNPNYIDYSTEGFITKSKDYFSNRENYLRFDKPVSVGTDFYVGYEVSYSMETEDDSFYVYSALRDDKSINTAFFKSNRVWVPFTLHPSRPIYTSLWIEPVIMNDTITVRDTFIDIDSDTSSIKEPLFVYSNQNLMLYVWLPTDWVENSRLEIFNLSGRLVKQIVLTGPTAIISFKPQDRSLYFLRISGKHKTFTAKFMKWP